MSAANATPSKSPAEVMATLVESVNVLADKVQVIQKAAKTPAEGQGDPSVVYTTSPRQGTEKSWGFQSFGHFAHEVMNSRKKGQASAMIQKSYDSELVQKAATGMGELIGSDGGFLIPPQFSDKIFERVYKENNLISRTDQYTVSGNSMVFPRNNESSRATGSRWGGVRAYWVQEGTTITRSAPTFGRFTMLLHKLACIAAVTNEMLEDSGQVLTQYLNRVFPAEISFLTNDAIIRGTGAGQPLGVKAAPATVTVTRDTAGHVTLNDVVAMWARLFRGMGSGENNGAAWFINQDVTPDLYKMTLGIGTAGVAAFMPPGGLSGKPYATLMGAPVVEIEQCDTLGTSGDIILADFSQMASISKGGMETVSSMHLYFDTDQQAFRTTFRLDAQPWQALPVTPYKGTNTQSPFVILS